MLSPLDQELVADWERRGLPVAVVCRGLRRGWEDLAQRRAPGAAPPRRSARSASRRGRVARLPRATGRRRAAAAGAGGRRRATPARRGARAARRGGAGCRAASAPTTARRWHALERRPSPPPTPHPAAGSPRSPARSAPRSAPAAPPGRPPPRGASRRAHRETLRHHLLEAAREAGLTLPARDRVESAPDGRPRDERRRLRLLRRRRLPGRAGARQAGPGPPLRLPGPLHPLQRQRLRAGRPGPGRWRRPAPAATSTSGSPSSTRSASRPRWPGPASTRFKVWSPEHVGGQGDRRGLRPQVPPRRAHQGLPLLRPPRRRQDPPAGLRRSAGWRWRRAWPAATSSSCCCSRT